MKKYLSPQRHRGAEKFKIGFDFAPTSASVFDTCFSFCFSSVPLRLCGESEYYD